MVLALKGIAFVIIGLLWIPVGIFLCIVALVPPTFACVAVLAYGQLQDFRHMAVAVGLLAAMLWAYAKAWAWLKRNRRWQDFRLDF
jgi:hypothetical protein